MVYVTVRFEQADSLKQASQEKKEKYAAIAEAVKVDLDVREVVILPVVVGARGGVISETFRNLKTLGISSKQELEELFTAVVRATVSIGRAHLDMT